MVFQALRLENEIKHQRMNLALRYCFQKNIDTNKMSEDDLLSIYSLLVFKGQKEKKKILDILKNE
jgi:hypothetical protein